MAFVEDLKEKYQWMLDQGDPRIKDWFWMQTPIPTVIIMFLYLVVIYVGPKIMKNREPFQLKSALVVYNIGLVILSAHITYEAFVVAIVKERFNMFCQPVDYRTNDNTMRLCAVGWWFYISKLLELLDTVFFILRKKNNQISFLHCYHHVTMTLNCWLGLKFVAGGSTVIFPMFNSFIHTLMYTYYGLAALGPSMQKYLWWKKYMTKMQLIQLVGMAFFLGGGIFTDCNYPKVVNKFVISYIVTLVILFGNFYYKAYIAKKQQHQQPKSKTNGVKHHTNGAVTNGVHIQNGDVHQNGKAKRS